MSWTGGTLDAVYENGGLIGEWAVHPQQNTESADRGAEQYAVAMQAAALIAGKVGGTQHVRVMLTGHANGPDGHKPIDWAGEFITVTVSAIESNQL